MIDKLQQISQAIRILLIPSIAAGLFCLYAVIYIVFSSTTHSGDHYLIPSFIGLLWAVSTYAFIVTFRTVPERANNSMSFFGNIKRKLSRGWYWIIGIVFIATTLSSLFLTYRMISIWIRDYAT
ncbi:MAG: hypothetical protein P8179_06465 [Candidatus Thiodiazotropha sp.]|jgi:hypothetical protein